MSARNASAGRARLLGLLGTAGLLTSIGCAQATAVSEDAGLTSAEARQGYSLGYTIGTQLAQTTEGVDVAALVRGFSDAAERRDAALDSDEMQSAIVGYETSRSEAAHAELAALAATNAEAGEAYRTQFAREPGVRTLDNGLQYLVLEPGAGDPPEKGSSVTIHYRASLVDGTEFDDSYARGEPVTVPLDEVLPGWSAALERMPAGAKWKVVVPPSLAYGEAGASGFVEPNATLIFEFERFAEAT